MGTTSVITLIIAVVGAVLGIVNTWVQLSKNRVRMKIIPKAGHHLGSMFIHSVLAQSTAPNTPDDDRLCVEVANLSDFPVTINEVGLGSDIKFKTRHVLTPKTLDDKPWPRRLQSRESVTVYAERKMSFCIPVKYAYATTQCGQTRYGTNKALESYAQRIGNKGTL